MEAKKDKELVVKLEDYMNKKNKMKESQIDIELKNYDQKEKSELLKSMFNEFLESDIMPVILSGNDELGIDKHEYGSIKNGESVNNIENNCCEDCKEVEIMKMKALQPIPKAIIVYIILSAGSFSIFATIFVITLIFKIKILDLGSCLVGMISTLGLLGTSLMSIKDWRDFIKDAKAK